jgi:hypothetical protein
MLLIFGRMQTHSFWVGHDLIVTIEQGSVLDVTQPIPVIESTAMGYTPVTPQNDRKSALLQIFMFPRILVYLTLVLNLDYI